MSHPDRERCNTGDTHGNPRFTTGKPPPRPLPKICQSTEILGLEEAVVSPTPAPPATDTAAADLRGFGYEPQLRRSIGSYAAFAAGFSFVSCLTTVFQLFAFGFSFGVPAFFWTWPLVFAGQFMVALTFAELAARY